MSKIVDDLLKNLTSPNLVDAVMELSDGEQTLSQLGRQVCEDYQRDLDSMAEWSEMVEEGLELAKQETRGKSEPWEGASNFKSPAIMEASISFGDRASTELLRQRNLVKTDIIGNDPQGLKREAGERVAEFMNYQLNHQMSDWRDHQEALLYEVPSSGCVFKKTYFCPISGTNKSDLIHYPDFVINQAATSENGNSPFTQIMDFSVNEIFERQASGLWSDVQLFPVGADGDEGSNAEEGVVFAIDNSCKFLEQNCLFDLDGDGYQEPYTVTVQESSGKVVRIVPRYKANCLYVKDQTGRVRKAEVTDFGSNVELVRIKPYENITKYGFIRCPEGTFLDIGYYHILSSLSKAINSTTNQLMDAGVLANLQGGFLAKGFRQKMGDMSLKPGHWVQTNISAVDLANGVQPHRFKEPSGVLFGLNEKLTAQIKELSFNVDLQGTLAPNAPATTTLALVQEAMVPQSAIMQRIIRAEGKEFKKLFELNSLYTDPELYQMVLDDPQANFEEDFNAVSMDVMPTASADMSSKMQRIQLAEALMMQAPLIAQEGGDTRPIREMYFEALGADELLGQVFPDPEQVSGEQAARMEQMQNQQRMQEQLLQIQVDHAERDVTRREQEAQAKLAKAAAEIRKMESEILLNLEKAETEETKNQLNVYTAQLKGVTQAIDNTIKEIEAENAERLRFEAARAAAVPPNIPSGLPSMG